MHCLHPYPRKFLAFLALSLSGRIFPGWEGRKRRFYLWRGFPLNSPLHAECNAWISCPPQSTLGLQSTQIKVCMSTTTKTTTSTKKGKGKNKATVLISRSCRSASPMPPKKDGLGQDPAMPKQTISLNLLHAGV